MFNYKHVAKEYIFVFIIATLQLFNVWADSNDGEMYFNYYRRNQNGSFVLGQIDATESNVDLFSYKASYDGNVVSAVTGYYYKSDDVKFVDTIRSNKVVKTEYFDRFDKTIYTRINAYRIDGFMDNVTITETGRGDSIDEVNKICMFFEKDPFGVNYIYYAICVWENTNLSDLAGSGRIPDIKYVPKERDIIKRYMVSEGRVNVNYQPLYVASRLFIREKTDSSLTSAIIVEAYARDLKGNIGQYIASINHRIFKEATSGVINGKTVKRVELIDTKGVEPNTSFLCVQDKGYEVRYVFRDDNFDENDPVNLRKKNYIKEDLYIERYLKKDTYEETGEFVLFCSDENVSFEPGHEPVSTLDLSFDVFSDNVLFMNHFTGNVKSPSINKSIEPWRTE
jgi:hypothetical protein